MKTLNVYKMPREHQHSWALEYLRREVTPGEFNTGGRYKHVKHKQTLGLGLADCDTK